MTDRIGKNSKMLKAKLKGEAEKCGSFQLKNKLFYVPQLSRTSQKTPKCVSSSEKSQGPRSLEGYSPQGCQESGTTVNNMVTVMIPEKALLCLRGREMCDPFHKKISFQRKCCKTLEFGSINFTSWNFFFNENYLIPA